MHWISSPEEWRGALPVALVAEAAGREARRAMLRTLATRVVGGDVEITHGEGRAPRLVRPQPGPSASIAGRGGWMACALAAGPVGIDIEIVVPEGGIPWRVLHPAEAHDLERIEAGERARAFHRLWTVKEAYLKACGTGLGREPGSFRVRIIDARRAMVEDRGKLVAATLDTAWLGSRGREVVASIVVLPPAEIPPSRVTTAYREAPFPDAAKRNAVRDPA